MNSFEGKFVACKTPITPTIKSPTKRQRDKDLLSDDDDPKVIVELEQVGGRFVSKDKKVSTGGFYVDRLGDHKVAAEPVFPQVKVSASYRDSFAERGEAIENPRIKANFNRDVAKRIELVEENLHEIFVSSPEGQRAIAQEGAKVFIRDGRLANTTATRTLVEASRIHQEADVLTAEVLGSLQKREYIDDSIVRRQQLVTT